ncbi:DUF72 domain-containing protein [Adhaeribacter aquaticus]|uniref:DUF72 domain-containing protein n=1 Tax=Adhaeribacter aquaticus TaxID=299567 RepID=UPI0004165DA0|nr:DUF72 domain-containing protein [Adhaeribacter aquaticus]
MEFGKVNTLENILFALPPDNPATTRMLEATESINYLKPQVYIGCPTWHNKQWLGSYYPADASDKDLLHWYSRQFNAIEVNTTYYRIPETSTIDRWRQQVSPNFKLCPKVPQSISQDLKLSQARELIKIFKEALTGLQEHLGVVFLQLSPAFGPEETNTLLSFFESLPKDFPLAVEFRHPAWFSNPNQAEILWTAMEALGISTVITDVAGRRDVLHARLTTATAFIRFNGYGLHRTDFSRIDEWVKRLQSWLDQGLQTIYFFIHQEDVNHSAALLNYLIDQLARFCGIQLAKSKPIPQLIQGKLF